MERCGKNHLSSTHQRDNKCVDGLGKHSQNHSLSAVNLHKLQPTNACRRWRTWADLARSLSIRLMYLLFISEVWCFCYYNGAAASHYSFTPPSLDLSAPLLFRYKLSYSLRYLTHWTTHTLRYSKNASSSGSPDRYLTHEISHHTLRYRTQRPTRYNAARCEVNKDAVTQARSAAPRLTDHLP